MAGHWITEFAAIGQAAPKEYLINCTIGGIATGASVADHRCVVCERSGELDPLPLKSETVVDISILTLSRLISMRT
jgi:hypothetical protein